MTVKESLLLPPRYWIPFSSKSETIPFSSVRSGIGDGEEKVIAELGAKHEKTGGYSSTFDLVIDDGVTLSTKWEVKKISRKSDEVRSGRDGKKAIGHLTDVLRCFIVEACTNVRFSESKTYAGFERDFVLVELEKMKLSLLIGEFSAGAFYGSKKYPIGLHKIVETLTPESSLLLKIAWENLAKPSRAFDEVAGLILVNADDGYAMITKNEIDRYLTFNRISLGTAKYVVNKA